MTVRIKTDDGEQVEIVAPKEDHSPSVEITGLAIEKGVEVNDHTREKPYEFTVKGIVSESPLDMSGNDVSETLPKDADDFFDRIEGTRVTVVSDRKGTFKNAVLKAWGHPVGGSKAIEYSLKFKQVRIATLETVRIPPEAPKQRHSASAPDEQDKGKKTKKQRPPQKSEGDPEGTDKKTDKKMSSSLYNMTH
ncbi:MAG: phage baseplate protein [Bradymonadaceae bacterium]